MASARTKCRPLPPMASIICARSSPRREPPDTGRRSIRRSSSPCGAHRMLTPSLPLGMILCRDHRPPRLPRRAFRRADHPASRRFSISKPCPFVTMIAVGARNRNCYGLRLLKAPAGCRPASCRDLPPLYASRACARIVRKFRTRSGAELKQPTRSFLLLARTYWSHLPRVSARPDTRC